MNITETGKLLAYISLVDHRQVDQLYIRTWYDDFTYDLDYEDAYEAVRRHRRESSDYLQVAHIHAGVKRIRAERRRDDRGALTSGPAAFQRSIEDQCRVENGAEVLRAALRAKREKTGRALAAVPEIVEPQGYSQHIRLTEPETWHEEGMA